MKRKLIFFLVISLFPVIRAQYYPINLESEQVWCVTTETDSVIIPGGIINANLQGEASLIDGKDGGICVLLKGKAPWYPSIFTTRLLCFDSTGQMSAIPDPNGNFFKNECLMVSKGKNDLYFFSGDSLLIIHSGKTELKKIPAAALMELPGNRQLMVSAFDSPVVILNKKIKAPYENTLIIYETEDFAKISAFSLLPLSSAILNNGVFLQNSAYFGLMLNNTILKGPDHHDINLYLLDKEMNPVWERHLTGKSEIGRLNGHDAMMDSAGNFTLIGYSNDNLVNFRDSSSFDQAYPEFSPETRPFYFIATYNSAGKLIRIFKFCVAGDYLYDINRFRILQSDGEKLVFYNEWRSEVYVFYTRSLRLELFRLNTDVENENEGRDYYWFTDPLTFFHVRCTDGLINTSNPPQFKIEKRVIPYEYFY